MNSPSTKLKEPCILLAGSNWHKLVKNVEHVLDPTAVQRLITEAHRNVLALLQLGESHLQFARNISAKEWRQRISRLYYAALNAKRAVTLQHSGSFSTDVSDHKKIGELPTDFPNTNTYGTRLANLRDDRNIADYDHLAAEDDLLYSPTDAEAMVADFVRDARDYLAQRGVK
jgi:hypothetical protein